MREVLESFGYFEHCARLDPRVCNFIAEHAMDNDGAWTTEEVLESAEVIFATWPREGRYAAMAVKGFEFIARGGEIWGNWNAMIVRDEESARVMIRSDPRA
jgi:hypothetical protein